MNFTARLGKRFLIRMPDEVIEKLGLKDGDIIVFEVNEDIRILKAELKV
jgi:bifunctional DNA-binding transcriptional regulator/antitoxin component of YhaV-PrlF toxin-antitoxin module